MRPRLLAHLVVCAVLAAPLFIFRDIPLFDLPMHIAQEHIAFDPALAPIRDNFYAADWRLVPNMALDLIVGLLQLAMPIDLAVRVFVTIIVLQLYLGAVALGNALAGSGRSVGLGASLIVFSGPFSMGFVNLSFGLGMALWVLALWQRPRRPHPLLFAILASLILVAHLYAFALYGLVIGLWVLADAWPALRRREIGSIIRTGLPALHLAVPVAIYLLAMPRGTHDSLIIWSSLWRKAWALLTISGVNDLEFNIIYLTLLGSGLFLLRRELTLTPKAVLPLAALAVAFVLLPYQVARGTWVDYRVPSSFVLLLAAGLAWRVPTGGLRRAELAILALFLVRMGVVYADWAEWQPTYQSFRAAFAQLPMNQAKLLTIGSHPESLAPGERPPMSHMDALAVAERGAFVPTLLADQPYQLLRYPVPVAELRRRFDTDPLDLTGYNYVLVIHPDENPVPAGVEAIATGPGFVLGRIVQPAEKSDAG